MTRSNLTPRCKRGTLRHWQLATALAVAVPLLAACGQVAGGASRTPNATTTSFVATALSTPSINQPTSLAPPLPAVVLHQLAAPQNDYTLAVPAGWGFTSNPGSAGGTLSENPILVSPSGQSRTSVFFWGLMPITDWKSQSCQPNPSTMVSDPGYLQKLSQCWGSSMARKWTPQEAVPTIGDALKFVFPGSDLRVVQLGVTQPDGHADASIRFTTTQTGAADEKWSVSMVYVLDAAYTALGFYQNGTITPLYHSFAFLSGCSAPVGQLDQMSDTCAAILRSFHPTSWLSKDIRRFLASQSQQVSAFQGSVDRIKQQEYAQTMARSAADRRVGQMWWNALGHTVDLTDGEGNFYTVEAGHQRYCAYVDSKVQPIDDPLRNLPGGCTELHATPSS